MQCNQRFAKEHLPFSASFSLRCLLMLVSLQGVIQAGNLRDAGQSWPSAGHLACLINQTETTKSGVDQLKESVTEKKPEAKKPGPEKKQPSSNTQKKQLSAQMRAKLRKASSMLDEVLASAYRINPPEYRILAQVEGATLLWQTDQEKSVAILGNAVEAMRGLAAQSKKVESSDQAGERMWQRLRILILRKIAALKPDLLHQLLRDKTADALPKEAIINDWTDEAQAIMSVALGQIDEDPKLASNLAKQSLPFGLVDWATFLSYLGRRDNSEAEQLAAFFINQLRDSAISPITLKNLKNFISEPARSPGLRDYFLQSVALRLRHDLRPDVDIEELQDSFLVAQDMTQLAATYSPRWQQEFDNIIFALQIMFNERSLPVPNPYPRRMIDVSSLNAAASGDTQEISDLLRQVSTLPNARQRDKEYQKLASQAAFKADISLAEHIASRIGDDNMRQETTLMIYGPLVRKAISESDWAQAQKLALNILDPLGRTVVLDSLAKAVSHSAAEKSLVKDIYQVALIRLERETRSEKVAKAFFLVTRALLPADLEEGFEALKSSISALNKLPIGAESPGLSSTLATWVSLPNPTLQAEDVLDLTDLIGSTFKEAAKRNTQKTLLAVDGLADRAFYSMARLAIVKSLLEEVSAASGATHRSKAH